MSAASARTRWYVVRTHAHAEKKAALNLERQGYRVYLPRHLKQRRHARHVETVPAPLFPGYLFVAIDLIGQRSRPVMSTFGVAQLLGRGDVPEAVAEGFVDSLRPSEDHTGFVRVPAPAPLGQGESRRLHGAP